MDEDAPVVTAPPTPAPTSPVTPTPVQPVPALDVKPPTPLEEGQRDGTNFYFRGRTEGTDTTGLADGAASRTSERTTTIEGGVSYGSGDRNGDGLEDHQARVDGSARNQQQRTNGEGTSTTTAQVDGSYVYTPSADFKAWVEAGFSTTSDGSSRTSTNYVEGGIEGRFSNNAAQRVSETALERELGHVYFNGDAARDHLGRLDRGFEPGGQSFAQISDLIRERGALLGTQSPAGLLDSKEVEQVVSAYANRTQAAIDSVKAGNPTAFDRALTYTQATRDAFTREFGDQAETVWKETMATVERDGYAAAARALPDGASETLVQSVERLGTAREVFGPEVMNAAEDQVSVTAYRAANPDETPSQPAPTPTSPSRESPALEPPAPEAQTEPAALAPAR